MNDQLQDHHEGSGDEPLSLRVGIVVIGRNEGDRLIACLASLPNGLPRVYVDSASTDDSVRHAQQAGAALVELDMSVPFSAGRARNEGAAKLHAMDPTLEAVQFLDGDTILQPGWLATATQALAADPKLAVVAGRRREIHPTASWYNELCDIEWDTPIGTAAAVGGDALYRLASFQAVSGFNPSVIAGEEPELCYRLRQDGHSVQRLDAEMTLHDAAIDRFGPWWKRAVRSGYASCLGALMHGREPARYSVRETVRALVWGALLPGIAIASLLFGGGTVSVIILALYLVKWLRVAQRHRAELASPYKYAAYVMLMNVAESVGVIECLGKRALGRQITIVEYK